MSTPHTHRASANEYILTLSCRARPGIVHAVTAFLVGEGCDITEHQQFDDTDSGLVFLRTSFTAPKSAGAARLEERFAATAQSYGMDWRLRAAGARPRVLVMVSKFDHCLADLLYRWRSGTLDGDIALVASNHPDLREQVEQAGVEFVHVPVARDGKARAEADLLRLVDEHAVDLVVLARYMQILSDDLCKALEGRAINIHHSFLPSFAGAKPYHQAHRRGVKFVGATAHYVTADLDEGPIIEQEVIRVDHRQSARELVLRGRDAECLALARAVNWHCQSRVLLHGNRTVVFN